MLFDATDAALGLVGGLLIGLSSAVFLLGNGRIAGISGVFGQLLRPAAGWAENLAFLAGLVGMPVLFGLVSTAPDIGITTEPAYLVAAGLLVGIGTRIGGGCTSGHGVCGMTRFSARSLVAVAIFMAVAIVVASGLPLLGVR